MMKQDRHWERTATFAKEFRNTEFNRKNKALLAS